MKFEFEQISESGVRKEFVLRVPVVPIFLGITSVYATCGLCTLVLYLTQKEDCEAAEEASQKDAMYMCIETKVSRTQWATLAWMSGTLALIHACFSLAAYKLDPITDI